MIPGEGAGRCGWKEWVIDFETDETDKLPGSPEKVLECCNNSGLSLMLFSRVQLA